MPVKKHSVEQIIAKLREIEKLGSLLSAPASRFALSKTSCATGRADGFGQRG